MHISIKIQVPQALDGGPFETLRATHLSIGALASSVCTRLVEAVPWKPHASIQVPVSCGHMDGLLLPRQSHTSLLSRIIRDLKASSPSVTGTHACVPAGLPFLPTIWVQLALHLQYIILFVLGSWPGI